MSQIDTSNIGGPIVNPASKSAPINHGVLGNNQVIVGVAGKRIAVLGIMLTSTGTVNVKWTDGPGGSDFTGDNNLTVGEGYVIPIGNPEAYWFIGSVGLDLTLNLSAAIAVDGIVTYREIN